MKLTEWIMAVWNAICVVIVLIAVGAVSGALLVGSVKAVIRLWASR